MAAFYAAAERGVKVKLLLDGMNEFLYLERSERFRALCTHENVELRIYNPIRCTPYPERELPDA